MNFAKFSVERPVTLMMIVAAVLIFGVISLALLPQELFPQIVYPQLTVVTPYGNAAPEEIETLITKPVEEAVGTVAGIKRIHSISKEGLSLVIAEFGWNQSINFAALGMREKIDLIKERLPREADEPVVLQYNPFDKPILILSITSTSDRSPLSLRNLTRRMVKDELEKVEGVASATISGGLEREIQIEVNQEKLLARNIPLTDVHKAITSANLNYPAGTIKESFYEYLIRTLGELERVNEIDDIAITAEDLDEDRYRAAREDPTAREEIARDKRLIYIKDVAEIIDGVKERTSFSRYNGKENISLAVQKQALGNTIRTINKVKDRLKELNETIPDDVQIEIVYDQSGFIKSAIGGVWDSAWQGGLLVFLVLFYFLKDARSAAIVTVTIPVSVLATLALMYFTGISINMMSLGGLAFGVGSLVDCSIVVMENIFRHMQMGKDAKEASIVGANEVLISVAGSVLTTVVVFLPLIFVLGIIGQISKDFALTVTFSLLASLIVSVTLIPLLASRGVKVAKGVSLDNDDDLAAIDKLGSISKMRQFFDSILERFLRAKGRYLGYVGVTFIVAIGLFLMMDKELMPKVDQGQFMIKIDMPGGTRLEVTNRVAERAEKFILAIPEVESVNTTVGSSKESSMSSVAERLSASQAELSVNLKKKRKRKSDDVVQVIKDHFATMEMEGARVEYVLQENALATGSESQAPVTIDIKGNELEVLNRIDRDIKKGLARIEGVYGVKDNVPDPSPEAKIIIDKDAAARYGLSVTDIAQVALVGLKGYVASQFKEKGQEFDIRVRLREEDRKDFAKLGRLELQSSMSGISVPLSNVASFKKGEGPSEIKRLNQERIIQVYANIYKRSSKDVLDEVNKMLGTIDIPKDYTAKIAGQTEEMKASFDSMRNAIIAAFLLVYMIMAALFESLWQPLIIIFTIPLSAIGVAAALLLTRTTVSAYVLMGFGILGGIVVNNAIVLIDCINLFRSRGIAVRDAVVYSSKVRLRPIFMTALTTILGLAPMAFLGGEGSELRAPMAVTVMGGLISSTFLTLVVIPTIYLGIVEWAAKTFKKKS